MIPIRAYWALLSSKLAEVKTMAILMVITVLSSVALKVWAPQILRAVIDGAIERAPHEELLSLAFLFLAVAIGRSALVITASWLAEHVGWRAANSLRQDLFEHVLSLDVSFHKKHTPGELIQRVDGDITEMSSFFSSLIVDFVANALLIIGSIILIWNLSPTVSLYIGAVTVFYALAVAYAHPRTLPWFVSERECSAQAMGAVGEMLDGSEDVAANGARPYIENRFANILVQWLPRMRLQWIGFGVMWGLQEIWWSAATIGTFLFGAMALSQGQLSLGGVVALIAYIEVLYDPVAKMRMNMQLLQRAGAAIERVKDLQSQTSLITVNGDHELGGGPLAVRVKNLDFTYPDDEEAKPVLEDVSFELPAGQIMGLVGRTGSGKSTLASLLMRLSVTSTGSIEMKTADGPWVEINDVANVDKRISMVSQNVQLLRASLRDNLTFFAPATQRPSDETIIEALKQLDLLSWYEDLPNGLDTLVDPTQMSAGQAQLVAFTRVFLDDPGLIVMDEASSRLDPATEALVEKAISQLLKDRSCVLIAHRLHTLQRADSILILDNGKVVESGDRITLRDDETSRFAQLLAKGMEEAL